MTTIQKQIAWYVEDIAWPFSTKQLLSFLLLCLFILFLSAGLLLQAIDPAAGVLDIGVLSVLLFALLAGLASIYCCYWLQELLWHPFKFFRRNFNFHFNQLTSWQQCIIYFAVFFLSLYAMLWLLSIVL